MAKILTRTDFTNYCLRRLGAPVNVINVDDDQVSERIDDALQYFQDYHYDAQQKVYYIKPIDAGDIANNYMFLGGSQDRDGNPMEITGVTRIFPINDSQANINMFDLRYQLRLNELYDFTSASYINYTLTMQHLRSLEIMFTGEVPIDFQRHTQRLYIHWNWGDQEAPVGQVVIAECYAKINPDVYPDIWDDRWLKEYATNLIKKQWATNIMKFEGLQLPGGVKLNGSKMYSEAESEIRRLEADMEKNYGGVLEWFMN